MKNVLMRAAGAAVLIVALAGCATVGTKVTDDHLTALRPGVTTEADAVQMFGPPTVRTRQADGSVLLAYSHVDMRIRPATFIPFVGLFAGGSDTQTNTVALRFGPDGKLLDTSSSVSAMSSDINGVRSTTPTPAQPRQ